MVDASSDGYQPAQFCRADERRTLSFKKSNLRDIRKYQQMQFICISITLLIYGLRSSRISLTKDERSNAVMCQSMHLPTLSLYQILLKVLQSPSPKCINACKSVMDLIKCKTWKKSPAKCPQDASAHKNRSQRLYAVSDLCQSLSNLQM